MVWPGQFSHPQRRPDGPLPLGLCATFTCPSKDSLFHFLFFLILLRVEFPFIFQLSSTSEHTQACAGTGARAVAKWTINADNIIPPGEGGAVVTAAARGHFVCTLKENVCNCYPVPPPSIRVRQTPPSQRIASLKPPLKVFSRVLNYFVQSCIVGAA